jgi:hypothetical protein
MPVRRSSRTQFAPRRTFARVRGRQGTGAARTAQLGAAEVGDSATGDAELKASRGRRASSILARLADIDCTQFRTKTGNIKLE